MSGKFNTYEDANPVPSPSEPSSGGGSGTIPESINESLAINSVSTIAVSASMAMANLYQHQVNHARRVDSLTEASLAAVLKDFVSADPMEVLSIGKLFKGEADSSIVSLLAQLGAGQQMAKVAQSTPGDVAVEINKLGATVASLQGLVSQLCNLLRSAVST